MSGGYNQSSSVSRQSAILISNLVWLMPQAGRYTHCVPQCRFVDLNLFSIWSDNCECVTLNFMNQSIVFSWLKIPLSTTKYKYAHSQNGNIHTRSMWRHMTVAYSHFYESEWGYIILKWRSFWCTIVKSNKLTQLHFNYGRRIIFQ